MTNGKSAALAAMILCVAATTAQAQPPVEAFGSLPFLSEPQLSPDGKHFAALQDLDGQPAVVIYEVNARPGSQPQVFGSPDWPIVELRWVKNDRVVMITKSSKAPPDHNLADKVTLYRALSLEVGGGSSWVPLFINNRGPQSITAGNIADFDLDDPDKIYVEYGSLYEVDVHSGRGGLAMNGPPRLAYWIMDGHGHVVARVEETPDPLTDHIMLYRDGSWSEVGAVDAREDRGADIFGLTFDGKALAVAARSPEGRDAMMLLDLGGGQRGAMLFSDARYDVSLALVDEWTGRVIGASYVADKREYVYFDPSRAALQRGIEQVFPGKDAHAVSVTVDGSRAIVAVQAPDMPPAFYFLDRDTHVATKIASEYPDLTAADLSQTKPYPYKARDGLDIPAYLTLPPGKAPRALPLVVMPHGGPDARDSLRFDWWAQFLANRGYAVFQPNFRGSKGYGRAFTEAGLRQWGLKMQDDLTDGVKKLIADGVVDPKRVCIVGASFGGYVALAGATFTPDLYACAVSIAGITDLRQMLIREHELYGKKSDTVSFWQSRIGVREDDTERLDATSPALHADNVRVPILLMHGRNDTTVNYAQSEYENDALRRAGKKVEFITFENDDHYFTLAETRVRMLRTLEAFLRENIGN